jgi:hypothetical protein
MNLVSRDMLSGTEVREAPRCECGAQPIIVRKVLDPRTGKTIRMFECDCGGRSWTETKE